MLYRSLGGIELLINKLLKRSISDKDPYREYFDVYNYFRIDEFHVLILPSHTDPTGMAIHLKHKVKTWVNFNLRYMNK